MSAQLDLARLFKPQPRELRQGLCAGATVTMFPEQSQALRREAQALCFRCPVQGTCLNWAIENNERYGVWGGVNFASRPTFIRRQIAEARAHIAEKAREAA